MSSLPKSAILLPLYIYPDPDAWKPLFAAISGNPNLNFVIIINPNSGPGAPPWWPNTDYVREIPKLNSYSNVQTVGYVRTAYCQRPIKEVLDDIDTYARRCQVNKVGDLAMSGIFFDETTNVYSEDVKQYLDTISFHVKKTPGLIGEKLVIHNPGTSVDARLADPGPDVTTVVENTYKQFQTPAYQTWLSTSPYDRSRSSVMVHSTPIHEILNLTHELRQRAAYIFVTSLTEAFYQSFGPSWMLFIESMAQGLD